MTLLSRLKNPETEQDWQLAGSIPDYARRLALVKLKGLLGHLLHRPIWEPQMCAASPEKEGAVRWPLAGQIAPVLQRALPAVHRELGWDVAPPSDCASSRELCDILALGFRELCRTQIPAKPLRSWPQGVDPEGWLARVRSNLNQHGAVEELIEHWEKHLRKWAPTLLIHGSCATLDHVPGTSDLDTLLLIANETLCDPDQLQAFISEFHKSQVGLFKFSPYMHHGHMFVTELELSDLREASLPLCLAENGVTFGARPDFALSPDSDLETLFILGTFQDFFSKTIVRASDITNAFDLLWWMSSTIFVPVLFLQLKDGHSRWKPDALDAVRQSLAPDENRLIDVLTQLRLRAGPLFPPMPESSVRLLDDSASLGRVIQLQKEATPLTAELLAALGVDDRAVLQSHAMYQRLVSESDRLFAERHFAGNLLKSCLFALDGKKVIELPAPIDRASYEATKEWIVDHAATQAGIAALYQYGEVGCPGLSDLDILVVMHDDATEAKPFALGDLPGELQEVMGHDATFISQSSLCQFLKVFPLFEAKLLHGDGADRIAASLDTPESVLPLYSIALLAKYPSDLKYLCRLPDVRFKTILAFLHSFKHFGPMFQCLGLATPPAVLAAIERDRVLRDAFAKGELPKVVELPEIMELMVRATAAVAGSLGRAWSRFAPGAPVMVEPLALPSAGVQFCDAWSEESFQSAFGAALLDPQAPLLPLPASLGWFVSWLAQGVGPASCAIRRELGLSGLSSEPLTAEGQFLSNFEPFAPFRQELNAFADGEVKAGRCVSKYVSLVDIDSAEAGRFEPAEKERKDKMTPPFTMPKEIRKILVPRFDTLGDIVLLEGFLAALLQRFPEAQVTVLVREGYDQLAPLFPARLRWMTTNLHPYRVFDEGDFENLSALLREISQEPWDLAVFTTYSRTWIESPLAAKLSGVPRVAVGEVREPEPWLVDLLKRLNLAEEVTFDHLVRVEEEDHETAKYQTLWNALFPGEVLPLPCLTVPDEFRQQAAKVLDQVGIGEGSYFVCAPAGTHNVAIKKWPADRFAEVIEWVYRQYGFHPVLVGHESEREEVGAVAGLVADRNVPYSVWLGTDGTVPILSALFQKSQLYLGNDTGPMHIAAAVGIPVVGVFGGGTFPRFLPCGVRTLGVASDLPCFGCGWKCNFADPLCLHSVGVEDVQNAVSVVLKGSRLDSSHYPADALRRAVGDAITIATSIAPRNLKLQNEAVTSWQKLGFSVISVNSRSEIEILAPEFPEVSFVEVTRDALSVAGKPYVYFDDILSALSASGSIFCGIVNSDIFLTDKVDLLDVIKANAAGSFIFGSRTDVSSLDDTQGKQFILGFDYFFFDRSIIKLYPKSNFCLGAPWWDYWAPMIPMLQDDVPVKRFMEPGVALHINHDIQWSQESYDSFGRALCGYLVRAKTCKFTDSLDFDIVRSNLDRNRIGILSQIIHYGIENHSIDFFPKGGTGENRIDSGHYHALKARTQGYRYELLFDNKLELCEADRAARLELIEKLSVQLEASEADRADRLAVINTYDALLKDREKDHLAELKRLLPLVSIVTPVFNGEKWIKRCIESVASQDYPNIEHIIVDGGSRDRTVEICESYDHLVIHSAPDRGQSHAINKGFSLAKGDILAWLCADDEYEPWAVSHAVKALQKGEQVVMGKSRFTDAEGNILFEHQANKSLYYDFSMFQRFWAYHPISQPATFWLRSIWEQCGPLRENLYFAMDYDLWLRMSQKSRFMSVPVYFAKYCIHPEAKCFSDNYGSRVELIKVSRNYWPSKWRLGFWKLYLHYLVTASQITQHYADGERLLHETLSLLEEKKRYRAVASFVRAHLQHLATPLMPGYSTVLVKVIVEGIGPSWFWKRAKYFMPSFVLPKSLTLVVEPMRHDGRNRLVLKAASSGYRRAQFKFWAKSNDSFVVLREWSSESELILSEEMASYSELGVHLRIGRSSNFVNQAWLKVPVSGAEDPSIVQVLHDVAR